MIVTAYLLVCFSCSYEDCLEYGENCSSQYLSDNYGTTDVSCCDASLSCEYMFSSSTVPTCN